MFEETPQVRFLLRKLRVCDLHRVVNLSSIESIFALPPFMDLQAEDGMKACFYIEANEADSSLRAFTPVTVSKNRLGLNVASCPTPPQVVGIEKISGKTRAIILRELMRYLRDEFNCVALSIEQRPHDPKFLENYVGDSSYLARSSYDIKIDLGDELSDLYFNMEKRTRHILRKSSGCSDKELLSPAWPERTNYVIEQENGDDFLDFHALWTETIERMYRSFSIFRKLSYKDPLTMDHLRNVLRKLGRSGLVKSFMIYGDEQPGAGAIVFISGGFGRIPMAYWSAGASSEYGRRKGLPTLLQWYIIHFLKKEKYSRYYMGGYDVEEVGHGPSLFKKGFGGQVVPGFTLRWISKPWNWLFGPSHYGAWIASALF